MPTTSEHIAARDDIDLQMRLIAAAEQAGIDNAQARVVSVLGSLISRPIEVFGESTSLAKVHAYAAGERARLTAEAEEAAAALAADPRMLPPGQNPGAVTDDHLRAAISAVLIEPTAEASS